jgi:NAD(P)H dehydrogenase (quinone)
MIQHLEGDCRDVLPTLPAKSIQCAVTSPPYWGLRSYLPADGPVSWVSRADLAEGTARLLLDVGHAGKTLNLTGPAALDIQAVTKILGRVRGCPLACRIIPLEEYVAHLTAAGKSEDFARQWATTYFGMARGEFGRIDPFLGALLGRPLRTMEEVLERLAGNNP